MRRALVLALSLTALPTLAADRLSNFESRVQADWSGAYVGAFGGMGISSGRAGLGDYSGSLLPLDVSYGLFPTQIDGNHGGGAFGVSTGMNFQSGSFVGGVEADLGYLATRVQHDYSRIDTVPSSPFPGVSTNTRYETDFSAIGTVRARGGYAFGDTLLFATAGLAVGKVNNRFTLSLPEIGYTSPDWSASGIRAGYAVGVGVEQRLSSSVSLKFETLYINFADRTVTGTDPVNFPGESIGYRFRNDVFMPRLGLSVKF